VDPLVAHLHVAARDARHARRRRIVAQKFLDRAFGQLGMRPQQVEGVGLRQQGDHAVADQVGRLVPGEQHEHGGRDQLILRQRPPRLLGRDQRADHVLACRCLLPRLHDGAKIAVHVGDATCGPLVLVGRRLRAADEGREIVGPVLEPPHVAIRHAQNARNHHRRQRIGEIGDQFDLSARWADPRKETVD